MIIASDGIEDMSNLIKPSVAYNLPAAPYAFPIFYATQIAAVLAAVSKAKGVLSGGGSGGSSVPTTTATASVPSFNLYGTNNNANNTQATQPQDQTINNNITVKAVVSETEITNSQQFITKVKNSAKI